MRSPRSVSTTSTARCWRDALSPTSSVSIDLLFTRCRTSRDTRISRTIQLWSSASPPQCTVAPDRVAQSVASIFRGEAGVADGNRTAEPAAFVGSRKVGKSEARDRAEQRADLVKAADLQFTR